MSKKYSMSPQRTRERAVFLYASALQVGDFDTVSAVLKLAEGDAILDQMLKDLDSLDALPESREETPARPYRNGKGIQQNIIIRHASLDGRPSEFDPSEEDTDMMLYTPFESTAPENPKTLYPFAMRFITLAAAILIIALLGGILIEMGNSKPPIGYPAAVALQTEEPTCAAKADDAQAESVRLAEAASSLLETRALMKISVENRPSIIEQSQLLAICALQTTPTPEADAALLHALGLSDNVPHFAGFNAELSPDGRYVLSMVNASTMQLWDAATGETIRQFDDPDSGGAGERTAAFSPDSRTIFSTSESDHTARLWDAETGELLRQFEGNVTGAWGSATFSPDGKYVLAGFDSRETGNGVLMWDMQTGKEVRRFVGGHFSIIYSVGVSPDSHYVATSSRDSTLILWDMKTGQEIRQFPTYPSWTAGADFSPDGQFLLSGGGSYYARLLSVETGEEVREFKPDIYAGLARGVGYSPNGRFAAVAGTNGVALLWDIQTGELVRTFYVPNGEVQKVTFSPDGNDLMTGTSEDIEWLWPVSIEDTVALACSKLTRDFTAEERAKYGLGEGAACPAVR